jgi:hypothetical protein
MWDVGRGGTRSYPGPYRKSLTSHIPHPPSSPTTKPGKALRFADLKPFHSPSSRSGNQRGAATTTGRIADQ